MRERATRRAEEWILERLNGEDGLGAIFPAMVNAVEVMTLLGYPADDPRLVTAAGYSVLAHLEDPVARGVVVTDGDPVIGGSYRLANGE